MTTTMDKAGRIVIPKAVRVQAGLEPGVPLDVRVRAGRIEIEAAPREIRTRSRGGFLVAEPVEASAPLTAAEVRRTLDGVRTGPVEG